MGEQLESDRGASGEAGLTTVLNDRFRSIPGLILIGI